MTILILEDNLERIEFFKRIYKNHTYFITADIYEAYHIAENTELDILFLDHDLEKENFKAISAGRTGYDFCKSLIEGKLQRQSIIYVHSMNPVGGQAMVNLLKDNNYEAQWVPFHLLKMEDRNG
jgi:CheY-like chemotaxis protein